MPTDSARFLVQNVMNIFICNYAQKRISKEAVKEGNRKNIKYYLLFALFAFTMIGLNQVVYFIFKPINLYEELELRRSMSMEEIKSAGNDIKVKIMQMENISFEKRMQHIDKLQKIIQVLSHPARRLTYDSFGYTQTEYAWAFKSQNFLLSTIIGSAIFYVICTVMNMISRKKGELKQAFKMQIMVMILLFLWEIELIMKTQNRLHQYTDLLDSTYSAFPIFERRQMIKIILIPSMNIIQMFFRFYIESDSQKKFIKLTKNPHLRTITAKAADIANKERITEEIDEKMEAALVEEKRKNEKDVNIYLLQRKALKYLVFLEGENILLDKEVEKYLRYFMIK